MTEIAQPPTLSQAAVIYSIDEASVVSLILLLTKSVCLVIIFLQDLSSRGKGATIGT
jgi:hypothetical protein